MDAQELKSFEGFQFLLTKCDTRICLLADYVRLCDMERLQNLVAWFWDVDTLVLKDLRSAPVPSGGFGHLISTMDRHPGCIGGVKETKKRFLMGFAKEPGDDVYMATPLRLPRGSPLLKRWIGLMREELSGVQPGKAFDHNTFMLALKDSVDHFGLNMACVSSSIFSPLPYHHRQQVLSAKYTKKLKSAKSIADEAFGVNAFWQSSRGKDAMVGNERGARRRVESGSVWSNLLQLVEEKIMEATVAVEDDVGDRGVKRGFREKNSVKLMETLSSIRWPLSTFRMPTTTSMQGTDFCQSPIYSNHILTKVLGEGTNGVVFLAQNTRNSRQVAIKCSKHGAPGQTLDMMEVYFHAALSQKDSKFIVKLFDAWASPFLNVLVLEKMDADCWSVIRAHRDRKMDVVTALHVLLQAARGVAVVHGAGVMHRDLHARNVLLKHTWDSALSQLAPVDLVNVKLSDFGNASNIGSNALTVVAKASARCGARDVMPPEILYRRGVEWKLETPVPRDRASSKRDLVGPRPHWKAVTRPLLATYNQKVDLWALGSLLMCMVRGGVYNSHDLGDMAYEMSGVGGMCGLVPNEMIGKYRWSVPVNMLAKFGPPPVVDFNVSCKLRDDRAAGVMQKLWAYDPESRPQARDLADALVSMLESGDGCSA